MTTTTERPPYLITEVRVAAVEDLTPTFRRIELTGPELADFGVEGPWWDQRIKLLFPPAEDAAPSARAADADTLESWFALPDEERGSMRTYTVRDVRTVGGEVRVVVDFALHPAGPDAPLGPGTRWASTARAGDRVLLIGPRLGENFGGIEFTGARADRLLLVGDETALPAIAGILRDLPATARGDVVVEVPTQADLLELPAPAGVTVRWCPRGERPRGEALYAAVGRILGHDDTSTGPSEPAVPGPSADGATEAVDPNLWETPTYSSSGAELPVEPADTRTGLYAWIAGESGVVTGLRRYLVSEIGLRRNQVAFMGYWRVGVSMRG